MKKCIYIIKNLHIIFKQILLLVIHYKTECDITNNCFFDNEDNNCKYIITEYYYRLFIKFLANDS